MSNKHIGLKRGTVGLVGYDPIWPQLFYEERQRLIQECGSVLLDVEHIGSTAVPGLAAKPLIDMIASVKSLDDYKALIEPLERLGYEYMPERIFSDRVFFPKGPRDNRTHHLSIVVQGSDGWTLPIAFRDYLRSDVGVRKEYQALKYLLASRYPNDRSTYTGGKSDFIRTVLDVVYRNISEKD